MKRKLGKSLKAKKEEEDCDFEPKLTRSKAKKLLQSQPNIVWPITPIKKLPELDLGFINEELPEESDDEEYKPSLDDLQDQSEEESGRQSVVSTISHSSALEISVSQYLESFDANLLDNEPMKSPSEHLFKVPGENIGQRTRSKLCLSNTPLEAIEKAFVPPDITTDMYDFKCDNEDWENFLKEFMQPLPTDANEPEDDDDEADPEYNALADEEEMYKEELKKDRAVKISRKELRKLMAELFECPDELSSDEEEEKRVKTEIVNKVNLEMKEKAQKNEEETETHSTLMTKSQIMLLEQQLRQHVQIVTQNFLQCYQHPIFGHYAKECKVILATLLELSQGKPNSLFNVYNLKPAFDFVEEWEKEVSGKHGDEIIRHMENEIKMAKKLRSKRNYYRMTLPPRLLKLMSESKVFLYPLLLPPVAYRCENSFRLEFVRAEDALIAIGLDEFTQYLRRHPRWFDRFKLTEKAAVDLIQEHLMPTKTADQIGRHIRQVKGLENNPISYYRQTGKVPRTIHYIIPFNDHLKKPPCERPKEILPDMFRKFLYPETVDTENKENENG